MLVVLLCVVYGVIARLGSPVIADQQDQGVSTHSFQGFRACVKAAMEYLELCGWGWVDAETLSTRR